MPSPIRDASRWAAVGLATGLVAGGAAIVLLPGAFHSGQAVVMIAGFLGGCTSVLALFFWRAIQIAGVRGIASRATAGAAVGLVLGLLVSWLGWSDHPVQLTVVGVIILGICGALNESLDVLTRKISNL